MENIQCSALLRCSAARPGWALPVTSPPTVSLTAPSTGVSTPADANPLQSQTNTRAQVRPAQIWAGLSRVLGQGKDVVLAGPGGATGEGVVREARAKELKWT